MIESLVRTALFALGSGTIDACPASVAAVPWSIICRAAGRETFPGQNLKSDPSTAWQEGMVCVTVDRRCPERAHRQAGWTCECRRPACEKQRCGQSSARQPQRRPGGSAAAARADRRSIAGAAPEDRRSSAGGSPKEFQGSAEALPQQCRRITGTSRACPPSRNGPIGPRQPSPNGPNGPAAAVTQRAKRSPAAAVNQRAKRSRAAAVNHRPERSGGWFNCE